MLVIGDEILSGRTRDKNIGTIADFCAELGIELREVRVVPDEIEAIVVALNELRARHTYLFTSGGIGPTHDDITADAVAKAFGVDLPVDARALKAITSRYTNFEMTPARLRMARIPAGGDPIENSVSAAPGIEIGNVFVMAGVPVIFEAMLASIAPKLEGGVKLSSTSVDSYVGEGTLGDELAAIQLSHPGVKIGSYPQFGVGKGPMTQIVMRSADKGALDSATEKVRAMIDRLHRERGIEPEKAGP
ncbi:MAG: molybdopterin-binding protein [Cucumibacter sp.]